MTQKLLKVQIFKQVDGKISIQAVTRDEFGAITYGHAGNVPTSEFKVSLDELLAKMDEGPSIKAPSKK